MKKQEGPIRGFVMNGLLLNEELKSIERHHGVRLLDDDSSEAKDTEQYDQFDERLRDEAREMGNYYEVFYCLERSIRQLVSEQMKTAHGPTWWDSGKVPQIVVDEVKKRITRELESGITERSEEKLDYTNFGELGEIIKSNSVIFGAVFKNLRALEKILTALNTLRNNIAHCCPLADDEKLRLKISISDWFRLME